MPRDAKNMQHRQRIFSLKKMQFCGKFPSHGQNKPTQTPENVKTEKKTEKNNQNSTCFLDSLLWVHRLRNSMRKNQWPGRFKLSVFVKLFQDSHKNVNYVCMYVGR